MTTILIIDDDDLIRIMLRELLEKAGFEVFDAIDGKEGLKLYRESPTDLIITDLIMPEKEGLETIIELKKEYPDVKIIAISGGIQADPDDYLRIAKELGAQRTLAKPFEKEEILKIVQEVLGVCRTDT